MIPIRRHVLKQKKRCKNQFCKKVRNKENIPFDEYLQINDLPFHLTRLAMVKCAEIARRESSYEEAAQLLSEDYHIMLTDSTLNKVTDYVGRTVFEADKARVEEAYEKMADTPIPEKPTRKDVFYLFIDGSLLFTRILGAIGGRLWKEVKLALMFAGKDAKAGKKSERIRIRHKEYVPFLGSVEDFKKYVFEAAVRMGCFEYERIVIISDGATWIRTMCEELFPKKICPNTVQILDFYHLAENVYTYAKDKFKDDQSKYVPWAEQLLDLLEKSKTQEALEMLKDDEHKKTSEGVLNLYGYIKNNINKIDYAWYKKMGWYIGSGAIESGNKSVVQKRCKGPGMSWNPANAQHMITLCAKAKSGLWKTSVRDPFIQPLAA
jgi:hypothetical protein